MTDEWDGAVGGHDEAEPTDAQIVPLLLRVPPLGDRGALVRRVDPGGEVRHVEDETTQVDLEALDHSGDDAPLDLVEVLLGDRVHRVPKAPVVERSCGYPQPPITGGRPPPLLEGELRARIDHAVQGRERDVGPDRGCCVTSPRTEHLVDDCCDPEAPEHLPHRGDVAEREMPGAVGLTRPRLRQPLGDLLGRAQVALGHDAGLSSHTGRLGQVVVGLAVLLLADDECHI